LRNKKRKKRSKKKKNKKKEKRDGVADTPWSKNKKRKSYQLDTKNKGRRRHLCGKSACSVPKCCPAQPLEELV
jgi:hypothetical protein